MLRPFLLLLLLPALPAAAQTVPADLHTRPLLEQAAFMEGFGAGRQIHPDTTVPFNAAHFRDGFSHGTTGNAIQSSDPTYNTGLQVGREIRRDTVLRLDRDLFLSGLLYGTMRAATPLPASRFNRIRRAARDTLDLRTLRARALADIAAAAHLALIGHNAAEAERFLAQLSTEDSVQTAASGLRYVVVTPGTGAPPAWGQTALVRLTGRLRDGSSLMQPGPVESAPMRVGEFALEGINEALLEMRPGERRRLYLPPSLGFGLAGLPATGAIPAVPPAVVTVFDVTLERVLSPEDAGP